MKKTLVWILVLALLAVASVLGTIAYLTDEATADNVMTVGKIDIDLLEYERIDTETKDADAKVQEFHDNKPLLPAVIANGFDYTPGATYVDWTQSTVGWQQQNDDDGYTSPIWDPTKINNEVDKMVFLKNKGDYGAYVRIYFAFEAGNFDTFNEFREMIHLNLNETGDWKWEWIPFLATNDEDGKYFIANATYKKELLPDDFTDISLSQIALDPTATNADVDAFGDTYEVFVNAQGIQSAGFKDPDTALDEGFGDDIPFEDLTLVTGTDLKTALHNLNGDGSTPITSKVATVTFGLNETYPNIVKDNVGTFTSVEQDAIVYTYYVPNATNNKNYDVYVLADSKIYTPKDSKGLFRGMTSLTNVDTSNMDVSRTEIMTNMFVSCGNLKTLNVAEWNVGNVTHMNFMFYGCKSLESLNVSDWNVSNATNLRALFYDCVKLTELGVAGWNVSQATDMAFMFFHCNSLTSLNLSGWDVSNVTTFECFMSHNNSKLTSLNLSGWNVAKAENMANMFYGCKALTSLDLNSWKNVGNVKTMYAMFNSCAKLETLKIGTWDVSGVTDFSNMFEKCYALKNIDVENWDVTNAQKMGVMFRQCDALISLDLSGWKTASLTQTTQMFESDGLLTTIYVGDGWDMSNVTASGGMFSACSNLKGAISYNAANANDVTYANTETGYLTYKVAGATNP
jgi:predicted ribosomally synthesized peptide with SipW-like signal peptide